MAQTRRMFSAGASVVKFPVAQSKRKAVRVRQKSKIVPPAALI
jgi:hypothetical protein